MKRITSAILAIAGASWLSAAQAQVRDLGPDVIVQQGLEPVLQMALRHADIPQEKVSVKVFPARAAQRAFCLSGKTFMLLSTAPLPAGLARQCHAGLRASATPQTAGPEAAGRTARSGNVIVNRNGKPIAALQGNRAQPLPRQGARDVSGGGDEERTARQNGQQDTDVRIVEVAVAREPLVAVQPAGAVPMSLDARRLFMALAAWMPQRGRLVRNPYGKWSDLGSALPLERIRILLPEDAREAVRAFLRRACERGVLPYWGAQRLAVDAETFRRQVRQKCAAIRTDGAVQFVKGSGDAAVKELMRHRGALALLARGTWVRNAESLRRASLEGEAPSRPVILAVDTHGLRANAIAGKLLPSLAEVIQRAGMLPPAPEERELLNALVAMAREAGGQNGQTNKTEAQAAAEAAPFVPGAAGASGMPGAPTTGARPVTRPPRALGGGVRVESSPLPPAGKAIDLMDLPTAGKPRP